MERSSQKEREGGCALWKEQGRRLGRRVLLVRAGAVCKLRAKRKKCTSKNSVVKTWGKKEKDWGERQKPTAKNTTVEGGERDDRVPRGKRKSKKEGLF